MFLMSQHIFPVRFSCLRLETQFGLSCDSDILIIILSLYVWMQHDAAASQQMANMTRYDHIKNQLLMGSDQTSDWQSLGWDEQVHFHVCFSLPIKIYVLDVYVKIYLHYCQIIQNHYLFWVGSGNLTACDAKCPVCRWFPSKYPYRMGPRVDSVRLPNISSLTMVYGIYNHGLW